MCKYCITDMIRAQEGGDMERTNVVIQNWMRLKDTIEFLGFWEQLSNPKFNCIEFEAIKASSKGSHIIPQPSAICKNCKMERARTHAKAHNLKSMTKTNQNYPLTLLIDKNVVYKR